MSHIFPLSSTAHYYTDLLLSDIAAMSLIGDCKQTSSNKKFVTVVDLGNFEIAFLTPSRPLYFFATFL